MNTRTLLLALFSLSVAAHAESSKVDTTHTSGKMAVLELVDLSEVQPHPEISEMLRKDLAVNGQWTILHRDSVAKRLTEFNINPHQGCNNPQCSFDVGNIVQAEYVVFGTASSLGSIQVVTLKLLHIPSAKIIWTKVLEAGGSSETERLASLDKEFVSAVSELTNAKLSRGIEKSKGKHGRSLAVVDLSESSLPSRVFFERVCTRIYGNSNYDLMSPVELTELLTALEINKFSVVPSLENMIGLGQKLGVSSLLYSRLYRDGRSYIYRLAMYDISAKTMELVLPPQPSEDLIKLLDYERVFFNTLFSKEKDGPSQASVKEGGKSNKALWISLGVLGVGGGVAAYWVENLRKSDDSPNNGTPQLPMPKGPPSDPNQ